MYSKVGIKLKLILLVALIPILFWSAILKNYPVNTQYGGGELLALEETSLSNLFKFRDYGGYYRFSPAGLIATYFIDKNIVAKLTNQSNKNLNQDTKRLRLVYFFLFGLIGVFSFILMTSFGINNWAALVGSVFLSTNFNFYFFLRFVSCVSGCLLLLHSIGLIYNLLKYSSSGSRFNLALFYIFFFLLIMTWEQWVNFVPGLLIILLISLLKLKKNYKLVIHLGIVPIAVLITYVVLRHPFTLLELTNVKEAQFVFSYPSVALMAEEMFTNISLHISNTIESLYYPWPSLSIASIQKFDMGTINSYNSTYTAKHDIYYDGLGLWYSGILFAVFCFWSFRYLIKMFSNQEAKLGIVAVGLILVWCGFCAHIPLMNRTYFILPGYMIGYKHSISILGFALFLSGWVEEFCSKWLSSRKVLVCVALCSWIIFCNFTKISLNYRF